MDISKDRIRRELKLIAKDKTLIESMMKHDESPKRPLSKSAQLSEEYRDSGNQLYIQDDHCPSVHFQILQYYNKSIAYAPVGSEILALAFGSKSALLRHLGKYQECICEIDKALEITESTSLRVKLLCRKAECLTALGSSDNKSCLQKANFFFAKLEDSDRTKSSLSKLLSKAQFTINKNRLDRPAEDTTKKQAMKLIAKVEKSNIWNSVKIDYSKKYGIHLVAARDFEPGEIVSVEKPYQNHLEGDNVFEYCCYCLQFLWAAFPCETCSSRIFCSERCKSRAWIEYHDMECPALLHMDKMMSLEKFDRVPFIISIFFRALKEAGSIDQLKRDLESLEKRKGMHAKNYFRDEKFTSYKSVYTMPINNITEDGFDSCVTNAAIALVGLADGTEIFNELYTPHDLQKLRKNDAAIFAGALLLKFCTIVTDGCHAITLTNPDDLHEHDEESKEHRMCSCGAASKPTNFSVVLTNVMTIKGCYPNIEDCIVHGNKFATFALRPIKEGDPLCASRASVYNNVPKSKRQVVHRKIYNCSCDCQACREDWTATLFDKAKRQALVESEFKTIIGSQICREVKAISDETELQLQKQNRLDLQMLTRAKNVVSKAWKHYRMPSSSILTSTKIMRWILIIIFPARGMSSELIGPCEK